MNFPSGIGKYKRTKRSFIRQHSTRAAYPHSIGGNVKKKRAQPSLPKLKCLDDESDELPSVQTKGD